MGIRQQTCDRCGRVTLSVTMSYFNTQDICPNCEDKERAHPDFERARRAEDEACRMGNYNYRGIGLPPGL